MKRAEFFRVTLSEVRRLVAGRPDAATLCRALRVFAVADAAGEWWSAREREAALAAITAAALTVGGKERIGAA